MRYCCFAGKADTHTITRARVGLHTVIPAKAGIHLMTEQPAAYILASERNGPHWIGVASDVARRVWQHSNDVAEGLTEKYGVHMLLYHGRETDMAEGVRGERRWKIWNRPWKTGLIGDENPRWRDLCSEVAA